MLSRKGTVLLFVLAACGILLAGCNKGADETAAPAPGTKGNLSAPTTGGPGGAAAAPHTVTGGGRTTAAPASGKTD